MADGDDIRDALAQGTRMTRSENGHDRDRYPHEDAIRKFKRGVLGMLEELPGDMTVEEIREQLA